MLYVFVLTSLVAGLNGAVGSVSGETCQKVNEEVVVCQQDGALPVSISCPSFYIIRMTASHYRVADSPSCPARADSAHCHVTSNAGGLAHKCNKQQTCTANVPRAVSSACSGDGAHYLDLVYNCEPLQAKNQEKAIVTSITSNTPITNYHLVYINSDLQVLTQNKVDFKNTMLGCIIQVPEKVQLSLHLYYMLRSPARGTCGQRIQIWDGKTYEKTLCATDTEVILAGCDVSSHILYMRYLNDDPEVSVGFIMSVGGVFVGIAVAIGSVMMVGIAVGTVFYRRRRSKLTSPDVPQTERATLRYKRNVYLDGNRQSTLDLPHNNGKPKVGTVFSPFEQ